MINYADQAQEGSVCTAKPFDGEQYKLNLEIMGELLMSNYSWCVQCLHKSEDGIRWIKFVTLKFLDARWPEIVNILEFISYIISQNLGRFFRSLLVAIMNSLLRKIFSWDDDLHKITSGFQKADFITKFRLQAFLQLIGVSWYRVFPISRPYIW